MSGFVVIKLTAESKHYYLHTHKKKLEDIERKLRTLRNAASFRIIGSETVCEVFTVGAFVLVGRNVSSVLSSGQQTICYSYLACSYNQCTLKQTHSAKHRLRHINFYMFRHRGAILRE